MSENEELKAAGRNFKFLVSADKELERQADETGKTMTAVLEDYLLGRRQFRPEIERFISTEIDRTSRTRHEIIESALYAAMQGAQQRPSTYTHNERSVDKVGDAAARNAVESVSSNKEDAATHEASRIRDHPKKRSR